ncbi:MAG TPA: Ig-like domain-containing protein [Gemmatimonadales bacterium]|nr:Ig-like domain-containing protein [Gemmatimonadales bacterium]
MSTSLKVRRLGVLAALAAGSALLRCGDGIGPTALSVALVSGNGQSDTVGRTLATPLVVQVTREGAPATDVAVSWSVLSGGGSLSFATPSTTDNLGIARAAFTLGPLAGQQRAQARVAGASGSPVVFTAGASADRPAQITPSGGSGQTDAPGRPLAVPFAALVRDQHGNPIPGVWVQWTVTAGGGSLSADSTGTDGTGTALVTLTLGSAPGPNTVAGTVSGVAGSATFSATGAHQPILVASVPIPPFYGIHDTYVRDGLAFVFAWDRGVMIFDVGNGIQSGSPADPRLVSSLVTSGGDVHNGWWFHNPVSRENRYLFIGQEGPGSIGSSSLGDIHVVDVSNLPDPREVAFYHMEGAGPHNFWMDESRQILYAAYYNGGVVALDVSGTLAGNLASRALDTIAPGAPSNTFIWGVQLYNGSLYAIDMLSGFWQLGVDTTSGTLTIAAGGNNVPERYGSDLWVAGGYAYTGTWGFRTQPGNAVKVWQLGPTGSPALVHTIVTPGIGTVSDVEVSPDGRLLMFSAEQGSSAGFHFYDLTNPAAPALIATYPVSTGVHTATFGTINGRLYAFGAKNPFDPALLILDVTPLLP